MIFLYIGPIMLLPFLLLLKKKGVWRTRLSYIVLSIVVGGFILTAYTLPGNHAVGFAGPTWIFLLLIPGALIVSTICNNKMWGWILSLLIIGILLVKFFLPL